MSPSRPLGPVSPPPSPSPSGQRRPCRVSGPRNQPRLPRPLTGPRSREFGNGLERLRVPFRPARAFAKLMTSGTGLGGRVGAPRSSRRVRDCSYRAAVSAVGVGASSSSQKESPCSSAGAPHRPPNPPALSASMELPVRDLSHGRNRTTCGLSPRSTARPGLRRAPVPRHG